MGSEHELVNLTNVGDNGEASVLRSYLEHHGIHVYIRGENHRSLLGMVGSYIELGVMVPQEQLEEARELFAEYQQEHEPVEGPDPRGVHRDQFPDDAEDEDWKEDANIQLAKKRAKLAALIFPLGGAHFSIQAPVSGLLLASVSVFAIVQAIHRPVFLALWALAVAMDLFGSQQQLDKRR
jgi:hypothetical protein